MEQMKCKKIKSEFTNNGNNKKNTTTTTTTTTKLSFNIRYMLQEAPIKRPITREQQQHHINEYIKRIFRR